MMDDQIQAQILEILSIKCRVEDVVPTMRLVDLGLASIDVIELAFEIEEAIGCELDLAPDDFGVDGSDEHTVEWLVRTVVEQVREARD